MTTRIKADLMLLLITLFWGFSYLLVNLSLSAFPVFEMNALRFLIAFGIAWVGFHRRLIHVSKKTLKSSALMALILTGAYTTATFGLKYTSLSNASFLSSLAVLFTPVLLWIFFRHAPGRRTVISVIISVVGIAFLTLNESFRPALGDLLCIICSIIAGLHLVINELMVKKPDVDAFQIGAYQLGFTGVLNLALSLIFETPTIPGQARVWIYIIVLSVFCTGLAFIGQSIAQQYTDASHVGVIYAMELVFAGFVAWIFAGEVLLIRNYFGAALLFTSLIISVTEPKETQLDQNPA